MSPSLPPLSSAYQSTTRFPPGFAIRPTAASPTAPGRAPSAGPAGAGATRPPGRSRHTEGGTVRRGPATEPARGPHRGLRTGREPARHVQAARRTRPPVSRRVRNRLRGPTAAPEVPVEAEQARGPSPGTGPDIRGGREAGTPSGARPARRPPPVITPGYYAHFMPWAGGAGAPPPTNRPGSGAPVCRPAPGTPNARASVPDPGTPEPRPRVPAGGATCRAPTEPTVDSEVEEMGDLRGC